VALTLFGMENRTTWGPQLLATIESPRHEVVLKLEAHGELQLT
jgi:hypothetical protein